MALRCLVDSRIDVGTIERAQVDGRSKEICRASVLMRKTPISDADMSLFE